VRNIQKYAMKHAVKFYQDVKKTTENRMRWPGYVGRLRVEGMRVEEFGG
jgi:hypothetical protein